MNGSYRPVLVRCCLDGPADPVARRRYLPLRELGLWAHLMRTRHGRQVTEEIAAPWLSEEEARTLCAQLDPEALEAVVRIRFETQGPLGLPMPVVRFVPAEHHSAVSALLRAHYAGRLTARPWDILPGYFVPALRVRWPATPATRLVA